MAPRWLWNTAIWDTLLSPQIQSNTGVEEDELVELVELVEDELVRTGSNGVEAKPAKVNIPNIPKNESK